ncbi:MalM family protein [Marinobacterium arenosum]|uniref:MalM family protein n=1 Tax=Marinobacterium arenosum TaxID=2862496 RepID=UPI001C951D27|nr:MalM family protein [Marinobacterium arenosum]MBY4677223.1 hypothetical protein [Marinobacterium arenosum]
MNKLINIATLSLAAALTTGCIGGMSTTTGAAGKAPLAATVPADRASCCDSLAALPYQPLSADFNGEILLDEHSPVYAFEDGRSFFAAFQLPDAGSNTRIELRSLVEKGALFQPSVLLLDSRFRPVRAFDSAAFPYQPAQMLTPDSLYGEISLRQSYAGHPDNERYLIIYSSREQQQGETQLLHPAKAYAKAKGNEPPNVPDPIARHSAGGRLQLKVVAGRTQSLGETLLKPLIGDAPAPAVAAPVANTPAALSEEPTEPALPETEAYYRAAIDRALQANDLDRALRLAEEARRVGATQVRDYLLQKLQVK